MRAKERRERILDIVKNSDVPVPANKLASEFDVSRQIIVHPPTSAPRAFQ